jgi:hypothetical protein
MERSERDLCDKCLHLTGTSGGNGLSGKFRESGNK